MKKVIRNCAIAMVFLLATVLISCEQDNNSTKPENSELTNPVFAGILDTSMVHEYFIPEVMITIVWDTCGTGGGEDSVNLLGDEIFDFKIKVSFLDEGAFYDCCPQSEDTNIIVDCWPSGIRYSFISLGEVEIATYNDYINEDYYFSFADSLNSGSRIDTITQWSKNSPCWCLDYPYPHIGSWYFIKEDKYLAIRKGHSPHYKYGWIRVGANATNNLIFKEYSIQK